jgi:hypothetical protein
MIDFSKKIDNNKQKCYNNLISVLRPGRKVRFFTTFIIVLISFILLRFASLLPENVTFMEAIQMKATIKHFISIIAETFWAFGISLYAGVITGGAGSRPEAKA